MTSILDRLRRKTDFVEHVKQNRLWAHDNHVDPEGDVPAQQVTKIVESRQDVNLISSLLPNGNHKPTLDLDMDCTLVASSTPGHYHLYIDHELTTDQYRKLIAVMCEVGLLGPNHLAHFDKRGMTCLRFPGTVKKRNGPQS